MTTLRIHIPGEPVPQGRPKAARWRARDGRIGIALRDPAKSRSWKATAQQHMQAALAAAGLETPLAAHGVPVAVSITARFTCPRSEYRKREPRPERPHTKRGDWDNLGKAICDAGEGILWLSDAQIYDGRVRKLIAAQGAAPGVDIEIRLEG